MSFGWGRQGNDANRMRMAQQEDAQMRAYVAQQRSRWNISNAAFQRRIAEYKGWVRPSFNITPANSEQDLKMLWIQIAINYLTDEISCSEANCEEGEEIADMLEREYDACKDTIFDDNEEMDERGDPKCDPIENLIVYAALLRNSLFVNNPKRALQFVTEELGLQDYGVAACFLKLGLGCNKRATSKALRDHLKSDYFEPKGKSWALAASIMTEDDIYDLFLHSDNQAPLEALIGVPTSIAGTIIRASCLDSLVKDYDDDAEVGLSLRQSELEKFSHGYEYIVRELLGDIDNNPFSNGIYHAALDNHYPVEFAQAYRMSENEGYGERPWIYSQASEYQAKLFRRFVRGYYRTCGDPSPPHSSEEDYGMESDRESLPDMRFDDDGMPIPLPERAGTRPEYKAATYPPNQTLNIFIDNANAATRTLQQNITQKGLKSITINPIETRHYQFLIQHPQFLANVEYFSAGSSDSGAGSNIKSDILQQFVQLLPKVKHLALKSHLQVDGPLMETIFTSCTSLVHLTVSGHDRAGGRLTTADLKLLSDHPSPDFAKNLIDMSFWDQSGIKETRLMKRILAKRPYLAIHTGNTQGDSMAAQMIALPGDDFVHTFRGKLAPDEVGKAQAMQLFGMLRGMSGRQDEWGDYDDDYY